MIVFNKYFKVAWKYKGFMILYLVILVFMSVLSYSNINQISTDFDTSDVSVSVINHDDSKEMKQFTSYIKKNTNYYKVKDDNESMKDALFFRKTSFIMIIPENYKEDVLAGKDVKIETMQVPDSTNAIYVKQVFNEYLNIQNAYVLSGTDASKLQDKIKNDLNQKATIVNVEKVQDNTISNMKYYYNFCNYSVLALIILVVSMVISSFNKDVIKARENVSGLTYQSLNRQLLLGSFVLTLITYIFMYGFGYYLFGTKIFSTNGLLYSLNMFIFTIFTLFIAYFICKLTTKREIISPIVNVIALGSSFICGSFVPQEMLSSSITNISKILPSYYYINNNELISKLTKFNMDNLQPVLMNWLIIILFIIGFYVAIQVYTRYKMKK
ncbi:MAG: ABC transporter permease [Thomasclavelia sp.]|nr:ABC transporter permease [Thomasclavelia sp.]